MQFNGSPVNGIPLNGLAVAIAATVPITKGQAFRWKLAVVIGGVDYSSRLTGTVNTDREGDAAGVAELVLQLVAGPVVPSDWIGRTVTIVYVSTASGETKLSLRFTGRIVKTDWDSLNRRLSCQCSDQRQQRVEAMPIAEIDAMIPGYWSPDVFEPVEGRSRLDYALERLGTIPASLDCGPDGTLRVSSWYAGNADFVFGPDTTIYESIRVSYAELTSLTNTVKVEADYRFARLWQQNVEYTWIHPDIAGIEGIEGFCLWRHDDTDVPDVEMVVSATESSGQTLLDGATYRRLPPTGVYCDPPQAWINGFPDLLLGATWTGARRWNQPVTVQYRFNVVAEESVAAAGEVIGRERIALEVETDAGNAWEAEAFTTGTTGQTDMLDEARRVLALRCILNQAATTVIAAHRGTEVSWDAPTSMVMGVDLIHTLRLEDQGVGAQGRCIRVNDNFDMATGLAITTLSIAVMRGGGTVSDALEGPVFVPYTPSPGDPEDTTIALPTQLGGRNTSPLYDEEKLGFAGNYTQNDLDINPSLELFPRRMDLEAPEIAETLRDERLVEVPVTYRVAIPNDWLEL